MNPPASEQPVRALIVDDEPAARRGLRLLMTEHEDVEVVGECGSVPELIPAVEALAPDVVFLDVRMPGGTAIEAFRRIPEASAPLVVLVTAYEEHALEAFDIEAVDYLLKPFTDQAFERSLSRVRRHLRRIRAQRVAEHMDAFPGGPGAPGSAEEERIAIRSGERIHLVDPESIRWIAADGDYVRIHTPDAEYLLRETMGAMEKRLPGARFVRIHRSTLVRADFIQEVRARGSGRYTAVFGDGSRRNISRSGQERLRRALGIDL